MTLEFYAYNTCKGSHNLVITISLRLGYRPALGSERVLAQSQEGRMLVAFDSPLQVSPIPIDCSYNQYKLQRCHK